MKQSENNEDFDGWEYSFKHYPTAEAVNVMQKGDQLCTLRAEVKTDADAINLLRLVGALTAIGVALDDNCPYLETRELIESRERRLVTWTRG